ncbi:MAG TPA: class I SAM-dependent methyltransferase [Thermoplasmata archaeon]|nr:class I SAM-dependent methyltransferase [Thermoplasmata archaeon]
MGKNSPFDDYAEDYDRWFEENKYVYLSELEAVKHFIPEGKKGVEIGVGSGRFAVPLGLKAGVDPSPSMRKIAEERGLKLYEGVAEALPFENSVWDFVLMVTTLCFVEDAEQSLKEVWRVLKDGGFFILGFIDRESPLGRNYLKKKEKSVFYKEAHFYSAKEVLSLLKKTGFGEFELVQTLFVEDIKVVKAPQPFKNGYGKGGFVVVRTVKKEKI